jgi:hypothetical protein
MPVMLEPLRASRHQPQCNKVRYLLHSLRIFSAACSRQDNSGQDNMTHLSREPYRSNYLVR